MHIFITGFMGAGKSYLGKELAKRLHFDFVDLDELVEQLAGKSVASIFEQSGEAAFRQMEAEALRSTVLQPDLVVATGGGAPCFHENMEWMNQNGITIYFHASPSLLADRLLPEKSKRPLLAEIPDGELALFIESRLLERELFYNQSMLQFNVPPAGFDGMEVLVHYLDRFLK